jgi:hypothetical protein
MEEQRKDFRVPIRLEVRWNGFSGGIPPITSDISLGGCYIESLFPVIIGDTLDFEFQPSTTRTLQVRGQILYRHPNIGFGVRFTDLNARQQILELIMPSAPAELCNTAQRSPFASQAHPRS